MRQGKPALTPGTQQRIVQAIAAGNYYEAVVKYAGIHYSTFRRWMLRGEQAKSGKYREFYEAVQRAEGELEVRVVALWQQGIPDNWQAARDFLARRFPERWANKEKVQQEISGKEDGEPIKLRFDFSDVPVEIRRALALERDEEAVDGEAVTEAGEA